MAGLDDYQQSTAQWRAVLESNQRRSRWVIISFITLYALVGLSIDMLITYHFQHGVSLPDYYTARTASPVPLLEMLRQLITFEKMPHAALIMGAIGALSIVVTFLLHNRIMLYGTNWHEVKRDQATSMEEKKLYNVVDEMRIAASLHYMPRIYVIKADYMNAFASGVSEKSAMMAITSGLLSKLNRAELQAVMAHELSHIRHMDIKLTLIATVLSNIMLLVTDVLFRGVLYSDHRKVPPQLLFAILILRVVLPILSALLLLFLSRTREYMADAGAVQLTRDNGPLASALMKIHHDAQINRSTYDHAMQHTPNESMRRSAYLYDPKAAGIHATLPLTSLFSTHPPLESRLNAIGYRKKRHLPEI